MMSIVHDKRAHASPIRIANPSSSRRAASIHIATRSLNRSRDRKGAVYSLPIPGSFAPTRASNSTGTVLLKSLSDPTFYMKPAILGLFLACGLLAQDQHVAWKLSVEPPSAPPGAKVLLRMAGSI